MRRTNYTEEDKQTFRELRYGAAIDSNHPKSELEKRQLSIIEEFRNLPQRHVAVSPELLSEFEFD